MISHDGISKGCGIVEFKSDHLAKKAIQELNDTQLFGRRLFLREDRLLKKQFSTGSGLPPTPEEHGGRQVFVTNVIFFKLIYSCHTSFIVMNW